MKKSNYNIEQQIKKAVENQTPDVLQQVLQRIEIENDNTETDTDDSDIKQKRRKINLKLRMTGSIAASFILMLGLFFWYNTFIPQTIINFDVNPSIELTVNRADKVLSATSVNEDGEIVLGEMNLKNTDLDVAINAIIGSMVKNGYIDDINNSILVSIDSKDSEKESYLQQLLLDEVKNTLSSYSIEGAVISQNISDDETLKELSDQYSISLGKATLIDLLVSRDSSLDFASLSELSLNDICLLIASNYPDLEGIEKSGETSSAAYIGEDSARQIVVEHAGIEEASVISFKSGLGVDDDRMVYNIEIKCQDDEYSYVIDATTGNIVEFTKNITTEEDSTSASAPTESISMISADSALQAALDYADLSDEVLQKQDVKLENKNNNQIYKIELQTSGNLKYKFEIDAYSGKILSYNGNETKIENTNDDSLISADEALSIALSHANISFDSLNKKEVKLDEDHDVIIYKVEFKTNSAKYEYKINASTGDIIKSEKH